MALKSFKSKISKKNLKYQTDFVSLNSASAYRQDI